MAAADPLKYLSDDETNNSLSMRSNSSSQNTPNGGGTQPVSAVWEPTQMISGTIEMSQDNWGRLVPSDMKTDSQGNAKNWTSKDLEKNKLYIGRIHKRLEQAASNHPSDEVDCFVVDDPVVSSFHCILERDAEENVWLTDKSTNGTYVNKEKIGRNKRMLISDGDEMVLVAYAPHDRKTKKPRLKLSFFYYNCDTEDDEMSVVKRKYHFKDQLGVGSFAEVWLGIHRLEGAKVAIKKIDLKRYRAMLVGPDAPE